MKSFAHYNYRTSTQLLADSFLCNKTLLAKAGLGLYAFYLLSKINGHMF